ncbi:Gfo/Idh/MocA family protein [Gryllotalpicola protaetiae]|uniref:Gfo/Idh/MocA family oxidoreductase n=1 Tax=Gryllotalpicola protaetiae TaxID=2419771 RepID=A0A387BFS2_9MICO|nr:Gfo/Idh/MocA family oxidoreductase [Gryllotalpicola protaetiae]AYG02875.1 gfo/Idh/MocA family oxidoreductase [Gryllotalpicola protaetiae]
MKIGFIGAGNIARAHGAALKQVEGVTLAGTFDPSRPTLERFAADFECAAFESTEALFDAVDAVYVLTPPKAHHNPVIDAIEHGKPVLCEKPITTDLIEARNMVETAEKAGVLFAMGFNNRARPQLRWLRDGVADGRIGSALSCWIRRLGYSRLDPGSNWRTSAGALAGMTIQSISHDIDMLRFVVGEITTVSAQIASSMPEVEGYDDNLSATVAFESGVVGNIHASWSSHLGSGSRGVVGTEGTMSIEGPGLWPMTRTRFARLGDTTEHVEEYPRATAEYMGYVGVGEAFLKAVVDGSAPLSTGRDGLRALEVSHALLRSAATGQFVDSRTIEP